MEELQASESLHSDLYLHLHLYLHSSPLVFDLNSTFAFGLPLTVCLTSQVLLVIDRLNM